MKIMLTNVRLAFPVLFTPEKFQGEGEPFFSARFIIAPDDPQVQTINAAIQKVAEDQWGKKAPEVLKQLKSQDRLCLHDGNNKSAYAGHEGMLYLAARGKTRPLLLGADKTLLVEADGVLYSGCYVSASFDIWSQKDYGGRVNSSVRGVQFYRHGDAFAGGGAAALDEFEDIADGADASSLV